MIEENAPHTKMIWSFSSHVLDEALARRIADEKVTALRLVFHGDAEDRIPKFIEQFRRVHNPKAGEQASIMVDLSDGARAQIAGLAETKEVQFGEKITMSPMTSKSETTFKVQVRYWEGLFREGAKVYMGYGHVVLKVKSLGKDLVELDVLQGGTVYPNMEIHIPETRTKRGLDSIEDRHLQKICDLHIEYLVLPGITDPKEVQTLSLIHI